MRRSISLILTLCAMTALGTAACGKEDNTNPPANDSGMGAGGSDAGPGHGGTDGGGVAMDGGTSNTDGGGSADAGEPTDGGPAGALGTCAAPTTIAGTMGTVSVSFDTTGGPHGAQAISCNGSATAETRPPQTVIAYAVPGTTEVALSFTLVNSVTDTNFDTVVEAFTGTCTGASLGCFDDTPTGKGDLRSDGHFLAMGGTTVYFVVGGLSGADVTAGPGRIDITAATNARPVLTAATAARFTRVPDGIAIELSASGSDADGNAETLRVTLLDAGGMPLDINDDGMVDAEDTVTVYPDNDISGSAPFTALGVDYVGTFPTAATQVRIELVDTFGAVSAPLTVPLAMRVGFSAACDATHVCENALQCVDAACRSRPETMALCGAATAIPFMAVTGTTSVTSSADGMIPAAASAATGSCAGDGGEKVFSIQTPAGTPARAYEIVVTATTSGMVDPVIYARSGCGNPSSEIAMTCQDDGGTSESETFSFVPEPLTRYFIFADSYHRVDTAQPIHVEARFRPLLNPHEACDLMGVQNRCATGTCMMGVDGPACPGT